MHIPRRKILVLFGFAVLAGTAILAFSLFQSFDTVELNEISRQARQRILLLENTQTKLFEAESAQRAYAFSGEPVFLEEYQVFRRELESYLQQIRTGNFTRYTERETLDLFLRLVTQRLEVMAELVSTRQEQGADAARKKVASREGKVLMDKIRTVAEKISNQQITALEQYREKALRNTRRLQYLLAAGSLLTLLILGGAFLVTRRELIISESLLERQRQISNEVSLVSQLNYSLQSCESHKDAAEVIRHYLRLLFPDVNGALYLMRASRNLLQLSMQWNSESVEGEFMDLIEPQDCWALRLGRSQQISKHASDMQCIHTPMPETGGYVCIPMMAQGEIVGLLHIRADDATDIDNLRQHAENLAAQIGAAIASITLRESLRLQNIRDPLTNLYNRRYLEETMEREQLRAQRTHGSFSIIMMDLDHFKQFNDTNGHQAGDIALKSVAEILQRHVRGEDIACRYRGEEFILVLPGADAEHARDRAELLRQSIEELHITIHGQQLPDLSGSFGVAAFPSHAEDWESVMHLADAALYRAKREGRNRVNVYDVNTYEQKQNKTAFPGS